MMHRDAAQVKANARAQLRRGMFLLPSLFTVATSPRLLFHHRDDQVLIDVGNAHTHWIGRIAIIFAIPSMRSTAASPHDQHVQRLWQGAGFAGDAITFGWPSLLRSSGIPFPADSINPKLHENIFHAGAFICFLFLSAEFRGCRFNISHDAQPRNPDARTASILSACRFLRGGPDCRCVHFEYGIPVEPGGSLSSGWNRGHQWFPHGQHLRFWSGKELSLSRRHPFQVLFSSRLCCLSSSSSPGGDLCVCAGYMFSGIWARAAYSWSRRRRKQPVAALPEPTAAEPDPLNRL